MESVHILIAWLILALTSSALGIIALVAILRPAKQDASAPSDVLILAAHPDDCVILAGEYAIEASRAGHRIRVLYLTCGSDSSLDSRALLRREEARQAWAIVGVPAPALEFLDLPQSPVQGPNRLTDDDLAHARKKICGAIAALPRGAAVFLPAVGESHCDHRLLRQLALHCLSETCRPDLQALEAPEYNTYYSLAHQPLRSLRFVLHMIPFFGRRIKPLGIENRSGFVEGEPGCSLPPDAQRLEMKRAMLRQFASEDGELLVRCFGHPDHYRRLQDLEYAARAPESGTRCYLRFDGRHLSPLVVLCCLNVWFAFFLVAAGIIQFIAALVNFHVSLGIAACGLAVIVIGLKRAAALERKLNFAAVGCGLAAGLLLALFSPFPLN